MASFVKGSVRGPWPGSRRLSRRHAVTALVACATLAGLALRTAAAQGDLWLDEVWSLDLVGSVHTAGAVLWGISHDNNHILNSLWLYGLGPGRPPWLYRALSVALGASSIPLAAAIGLRQGRVSGVAAAWLLALGPPFVLYGSEARGYAGLIVATLAAIHAWQDRSAAHDPAARWRDPAAWRIAVAIGLGALFHFTMLATLALLMVATVLGDRRRGLSWRDAFDASVALFTPSIAALLPAMAAVVAGILVRGGFTVGGSDPFTVLRFVTGYSDQLAAVLGGPATLPRGAAVVLAAAAAIACMVGTPASDRRDLAVAALLILPGTMALARLPNLEFARYFTAPGIVLALLLADAAGRVWALGPWGQIAAGLGLAALLAGQAADDRPLLTEGRGRYADALALMASDGRPTYAADRRFQVETVMRATADRRGVSAVYQAIACSGAPDWYVDVEHAGPDAPPAVALGPAACRVDYAWRATFPSPTWSGMRWTLYRRTDLDRRVP